MIFSRTVGVRYWECPNCGHFNRTKVDARNGWKVRCRDANCQRVYIVGEVFYETVPGFKAPPIDHIMARELAKELWRSGQPVNRVLPLLQTGR